MIYSEEFRLLVNAYKKIDRDGKVLLNNKFGNLVINKDTVLAKNEIKGFHIKNKSIKEGVRVGIFIDEGARIEFPIHLCFGMLPKEGRQLIKSEFFIGKGAKVKFFAHCLFPNAVHIEHIMDAKIYIGENAEMSYLEEHYHGDSGGTWVYPRLKGEIDKDGKLFEEFKITNGRVGVLNIDYEIEQEERSSCELLTRVYGKGDDKIEVRESLKLNGVYAAGIAKSKIMLIDNASGTVLGEIAGNAAYTRGHVDCQEIVRGEGAKASSMPKISVNNSLAKVTHEAAIGRIDKKKLETLMARGLTEEEAVDFIVRGLLK
jgi:Fe-S cluster assembly scaffold protein SufB